MTEHNFTSWTNQDWRTQATVLDASGAPRDITGATVFLNVERHDGTPVLKLSLAKGLAITDALNGKIEVAVLQEQMKTLPAGLYLYDLVLEAGGERINVKSGSLHLRHGVTQWPTLLAAIFKAQSHIATQAVQVHNVQTALLDTGNLLANIAQNHKFQPTLTQTGSLFLAALKVGALMDLDFSTNQASMDGTPLQISALLTCPRATSGWGQSVNGDLQEFTAGVLRITDKGLLTEGARSNLYTSSDSFPNANSVTTPAPTNNTQAAPDSTLTAWSFPTGATGFCQSNTTLPADSEDYTFSIYVKPLAAGARYGFSVGVYGIDTSGPAFYDFDTDAFTSGSTLDVEKFANGWYRFSRTFTNDGTGTVFIVRIDPYAGHEEKVAYWGIQVEQGSFPSSRIKTSGAALTRAADEITFSDLSWHNAAAGTFLINFHRSKKYSANYLKEDPGCIFSMGANSGSIATHLNMFTYPASELSGLHWRKGPSGTTVTVSYGERKTWRERHVLAFEPGVPIRAFSAGEMHLIGTIPFEPTPYLFAKIGRRTFNDQPAFGWMENITFWPDAKTQAEMQALALTPSSGNIHLLGDSFVQQTSLDALRHTMMDQYRVYSFDGVGGSSLASHKIRFDATPDKYDRILLIWDGGLTDSEQEAIDAIDGMVAHLTGSQWAYIEPDGSIDDTKLANIVSHINTTYGTGHYIPTLAALQAANDGTAGDLADVAAGLVPGSLRSDSIHLNDAGQQIASREIMTWLVL